jgi:hypothetical protein
VRRERRQLEKRLAAVEDARDALANEPAPFGLRQ